MPTAAVQKREHGNSRSQSRQPAWLGNNERTVERARDGEGVNIRVPDAVRPSWAIGTHNDLNTAVYDQIFVERDRSEISGHPRRQSDASASLGL